MKGENNKTAAKAGISPPSYGFPSALLFRHLPPHCRLLLFYYSATVFGLKARTCVTEKTYSFTVFFKPVKNNSAILILLSFFIKTGIFLDKLLYKRIDISGRLDFLKFTYKLFSCSDSVFR